MGGLSGGFGSIADLADMVSRIDVKMNKLAELRRAIGRDNAAEFIIVINSRGTYPSVTFSVM